MKIEILLAFCLLFARPVWGSNDALSAYYVPEKVALTGTLSDPAWEGVPEHTGFIKIKGGEPKAQTFVKMLYDDECLYFGIRFEEPQPSKIMQQHNQNDLAIYNDDCFEVVFDTRGSPETFYHFVVNFHGAVFDSRNSDKNWSSYKTRAKASLHEKEWRLEVAIPFADLDIPAPIFGEQWQMRLGRERKTEAENSSLPATDVGLFARRNLAPLTFHQHPKRPSPIEALVDVAGLQWGQNRITVQLANRSETPQSLTVSASALGDGSHLLNRWTEEITLPVEGTGATTFRVPLERDDLERVTLTIADGEGRAVWGKVLEPAFQKGAVTLSRLEKELPLFQADLLLLSRGGKAAEELVREPVEAFSLALAEFRRELSEAVEKNQLLPKGRWEAMLAEAEKFQRWKVDHEMLIWEADPWTNGSPHFLPERPETSPPVLTFRQAQNEREARAVELTGLLSGGRQDLRLAVEDFKPVGEGKGFLSRDHVHIYHSPWVRDGFGRLINDPLVQSENNAIVVTPGQAERVWIVFDSRGVEAGEYEGEIVVKPVDTAAIDRGQWKRIPLRVTVLPFSLPETREWPLDTFIFGPGITPVNEMALLRLYEAYHVNWMMTNRFAYMWESKNDGTVWLRDPKKKVPHHLYYDPQRIKSQDTFLREAQRLGMRLMFGWNATRNLDWYDEMIPYLEELGFEKGDYAFQGMSDEFRAERIPEHMEFHRALYERQPAIHFMATLTSVPPPSGSTHEQLEEPAKYVSIWNQHMPRLWPLEASDAAKNVEWFRERNRTIWAYVCATQMQNWPVHDYYRLAPWRAYLAGADGISIWTAMASKGDGFDHGDGYDEGLLFRGIDRAPVTTKRMEALREGLEDVAYMAILKKAIEKSDIEEDTSKFQHLLREKPLQIEKAPDTASIQQWREKIIDAILHFQPALNK